MSEDNGVPLAVAERLLKIDVSYKVELRWLVDHNYIDYVLTPDSGQAPEVVWWMLYEREGKLTEFHFQFVNEGSWWVFRIIRGCTQIFKGRVATVLGAYKEARDKLVDRLMSRPGKTSRHEQIQDTLNVLEQLMKEEENVG